MSPAMPGMFNDRPVMGSYGSPWQQGDGIMMACALGAKLVNPWCAYNVAPGLERKVEDNSAGYISMPGIFVSTDGQRHVLESGRPTENVVGDVWKQPNGYVWNIWDQGPRTRRLISAALSCTAAMDSRKSFPAAISSRPTLWKS